MDDRHIPAGGEFLAHGAAADVWLLPGKHHSYGKALLTTKVDQWKPVAHANVVQILDINERLDLRVEYLANGPAPQYLARGSPDHIPLRKRMIEDILSGLNYLHSQSPPVVHGCIRMDKLFVDTRGTTKIGEFGLASLLGGFEFFAPSVSQAGQIRWTSPELLQASGDQRPTPTTASDVWALGCTLFEIVSGKLPYFKYKHDLRVGQEIISKRAPGHLNSLLDPDFAQVWSLVASCWKWTPEERPTIKELEQSIRWSVTEAEEKSTSQQLQTAGIAYGAKPRTNKGAISSLSSLSPNRPGELDNLERAMAYMRRELVSTSDGHPDLPKRLSRLGISYGDRFKCLGELGDLEKAIEHISRALSLALENDPDQPKRLGDLGEFHGYRFHLLGDLDDLEKAMEYTHRAVALTPSDHPELPCRLNNLGALYGDQFFLLNELAGSEKAIEYGSRALALTPDGHPDLPTRLHELRVLHGNRSTHSNAQEIFEKAIECMSRAFALTPDGHPHLPSQLAGLGMSHRNRFERLGDLEDLEKAIEYASRALALTPDGHPDLSIRHADLGVSHTHRFQRLGELGDVEKAIEYTSRALALTPDSHPHLSILLQDLGVSHTHRFQRLGELGDVEKAIEYGSRALALTPDSHPQLSILLQNLGVSHAHRFQRLGELGDIEKAIEYGSRALALTPDGHPHLSILLQNLGVSHTHRFQRLGELGDVETAIEYESRALELTPDGHPDLSIQLAILGMSYRNRFEHLGEPEDLENAIGCGSRALELTPDDHPTLPDKHFLLAESSLLRYRLTQLTGNPSDLQGTLDSFRMATQSLAGSPRNKFKYALQWAEFASKESLLNCIEAYQTAINILPQFIWLGATTNQRYQDLVQAQNLATRAAAAAILASEYKLALEWLENARCVVWNQSLMLRLPLDQLHASHPALATRLQAISNQLHNAGSESRESQALTSGSLTLEQVAQRHRRLAMEYDELISQTRALPGFENFLRPIKANTLVTAAHFGPIVVINCHEDRCDALVISPGRDTIEHVPLPNFNGETAQNTRLEMEKSVQNSQLGSQLGKIGVKGRPVPGETFNFKTVLLVLWHDVVKPILDFLGYTIHNSTGNLPHITWCPTGVLSFLPLHAAGDYDRPQSRVFDYVISSYTPTLTALLISTPSSVDRNTKVLAIGQPNTPGHTPLPSIVKELAYLKLHTLNKVEYTEILGNQATVAAVLDGMEQHDWVHLACHAHQNVQDPTKSGFFLHDDTLDLASINRRSFKKRGLAYLSAAQTATGD
ncbi:unnamed protein product, partial [Rhizoctonia solani]